MQFLVTLTAEQAQVTFRVPAARGETFHMMIVQVALSAAAGALSLVADSNSNLDILRDVAPLSHTQLHLDGETLAAGCLAVLADSRDDRLRAELLSAVDAAWCRHILLSACGASTRAGCEPRSSPAGRHHRASLPRGSASWHGLPCRALCAGTRGIVPCQMLPN